MAENSMLEAPSSFESGINSESRKASEKMLADTTFETNPADTKSDSVNTNPDNPISSNQDLVEMGVLSDLTLFESEPESSGEPEPSTEKSIEERSSEIENDMPTTFANMPEKEQFLKDIVNSADLLAALPDDQLKEGFTSTMAQFQQDYPDVDPDVSAKSLNSALHYNDSNLSVGFMGLDSNSGIAKLKNNRDGSELVGFAFGSNKPESIRNYEGAAFDMAITTRETADDAADSVPGFEREEFKLTVGKLIEEQEWMGLLSPQREDARQKPEDAPTTEESIASLDNFRTQYLPDVNASGEALERIVDGANSIAFTDPEKMQAEFTIFKIEMGLMHPEISSERVNDLLKFSLNDVSRSSDFSVSDNGASGFTISKLMDSRLKTEANPLGHAAFTVDGFHNNLDLRTNYQALDAAMNVAREFRETTAELDLTGKKENKAFVNKAFDFIDVSDNWLLR